MNEKKIAAAVFVLLLGLTLFTALSYFFHWGRSAAVTLALAIASIKAALIAYHYMHLKHERALIYAIAVTGIIAILILSAGIFPDMALKL